MIALSKRLQAVAHLVTPGGVVADIGCDHAHLAMYLYENSLCKSVIACDVNDGPIEIARQNIAAAGYANAICVRKADGLSGLSVAEADSIVIAGMGGRLIIRIIEEGLSRIDDNCELILQPQSDVGEVRRFLDLKGFAIVKEDIVFEDGKFYPMIKSSPKSNCAVMKYVNDADYEYGGFLIRTHHPVLIDFLRYKKSVLTKILGSIDENGGGKKSNDKRGDIVKELELVETTLVDITQKGEGL